MLLVVASRPLFSDVVDCGGGGGGGSVVMLAGEVPSTTMVVTSGESVDELDNGESEVELAPPRCCSIGLAAYLLLPPVIVCGLVGDRPAE